MKTTPQHFIHTAKQILCGEFDGVPPAPDSPLIRQLGQHRHALCQQAAEKLRRDYLAAYPPKGKLRNA